MSEEREAELERHNRELTELLEQSERRAEAYRQEFTDSDTQDQDIANNILKGSKEAAATRIVYLMEHADTSSTQYNASKYILEFDQSGDGATRLEDLVAKLSS